MPTTSTTHPSSFSCRSCGPSGFDHKVGTPHRLGCIECAHNFGDHLDRGSGRCSLCPCEGRPVVSVVRTVTTGAVSVVTRERARQTRPVKLGGQGRPRVNDAGERACDG